MNVPHSHDVAKLWFRASTVAPVLLALACGHHGAEDANTAAPPAEGAQPPAPVHWAFADLSPAPAPDPQMLSNPTWVRNEIDAFVLAKLDVAALGLAPSPLAAPETQLRRVTLALTGLPPTAEELDAFLADPSDEAYTANVERLLGSRRYAEHMASNWLDLARYADTDGFQYDMERPAWQWRDWVLQALDQNMPYDQFTTLQLAGDLVPNPTPESYLATGFNRNHAIQDENGLVINEYRTIYVADRVETLGKVWLGLTMGCARCHDHKYDPTTAKDFFSLYDCFNQIDEKDAGFLSQYTPTMKLDSPLKAELEAELDSRIEALKGDTAAAANVAELEWDKNRLAPTADLRIMTDMPVRRTTQVLAQGRYDLPVGDPVTCRAPSFLPPFPSGAPENRLGLAQWLMMPDNPLTHRVTVNRIWSQFFGKGLVPAVDNFGMVTGMPTHIALLDWLSREFIQSGFDVKALHKRIVLSSTFRQSSVPNDTAPEADPNNDYFTRFPRQRLSAETIRDIPLFVSGLLVERFGGPPAFPYQPPGLWESLGWDELPLTYPALSGDGLYRRSVYSYWKRTLPPVFLSIFDAPSRELSTASRSPDTSPQQALALLNDPTVIRAARTLSNHLWERHPSDVEQSIAAAFRMSTSRTLTPQEATSLRAVYDAQLVEPSTQTFGVEPTAASDAEVFALSQVVRVVFNLNETISLE